MSSLRTEPCCGQVFPVEDEGWPSPARLADVAGRVLHHFTVCAEAPFPQAPLVLQPWVEHMTGWNLGGQFGERDAELQAVMDAARPAPARRLG